MAGYGTVSAFAKELGESEHVTLLTETLEEEKETDEKLSGLAGDINPKANQDKEAGDEGGKTSPKKQSRNAA
jgi:ferritin-like metal-binding protein YciE